MNPTCIVVEMLAEVRNKINCWYNRGMKKVLIIHGWESGSKGHWYQEEKNILEKIGYIVAVPDMPNAKLPVLEKWVEVVENFNPDENSVLIGHSLGAPTILRYLEKAQKKVGKVILIAGFSSTLNMDYPNAKYPDSFVKNPFDWEKIKKMTGEIVVLNQVNDPWVPVAKGEEIAQKTGGTFVKVQGSNHFDQMDLDLINSRL